MTLIHLPNARRRAAETERLWEAFNVLTQGRIP